MDLPAISQNLLVEFQRLNHPNHSNLCEYIDKTFLPSFPVISRFFQTEPQRRIIIIDLMNMLNDEIFIQTIIQTYHNYHNRSLAFCPDPVYSELFLLLSEYNVTRKEQLLNENYPRAKKFELGKKMIQTISKSLREYKFIIVTGDRSSNQVISTIGYPSERNPYVLAMNIVGSSFTDPLDKREKMEADDLLIVYLITLLNRFRDGYSLFISHDRYRFMIGLHSNWETIYFKYRGIIVTRPYQTDVRPVVAVSNDPNINILYNAQTGRIPPSLSIIESIDPNPVPPTQDINIALAAAKIGDVTTVTNFLTEHQKRVSSDDFYRVYGECLIAGLETLQDNVITTLTQYITQYLNQTNIDVHIHQQLRSRVLNPALTKSIQMLVLNGISAGSRYAEYFLQAGADNRSEATTLLIPHISGSHSVEVSSLYQLLVKGK